MYNNTCQKAKGLGFMLGSVFSFLSKQYQLFTKIGKKATQFLVSFSKLGTFI